MLASVQWFNRYLDPADLTADEAIDVLERTSFPIEDRADLPNGDTQLDVELTSNRGDAFSHIALAREIALATNRRIKLPEALHGTATNAPDSGNAASHASISVTTPDLCPRFTARIITGVTVGPSPQWLQNALEAVGLRPINNIVDITNFVLYETGHPSHVFDLDTLEGKQLIIRHAQDGETLQGLDDKKHTLTPADLIIADAKRPVSIAGIVGGTDTGVTQRTTNVLLEVATWDPITVRRSARRMQVSTDAAYRFERTVDPRDIPAASNRLATLILELAGGTLVDGMNDIHTQLPPRPVINLRPHRCNTILGIDIDAAEMTRLLEGVGFDVTPGPTNIDHATDPLACAVPHSRVHEVTREIDVIEEIARLHGIDNVPVTDSLPISFAMDHPADWEHRERTLDLLANVLNGQGYYETVTFSFASEADTTNWMPDGLRSIKIDEQRRREMPFLRPSIIPSLLDVRRANQDGRVVRHGGIRLYEIASVFADKDNDARRTVEHRNLALLADVDQYTGKAQAKADAIQHAFRAMVGTIQQLVATVGGPFTTCTIEPTDHFLPALKGETVATVSIDGQHAGYITTITAGAMSARGLDVPVIVAEIGINALIALYPPKTTAELLPAHPAIERDLSVIVDEATPWAAIKNAVTKLALQNFVACDFVGTFRGQQVGQGKKSVTLRITFRDPARTLRHEEADDAMQSVIDTLTRDFSAKIRK